MASWMLAFRWNHLLYWREIVMVGTIVRRTNDRSQRCNMYFMYHLSNDVIRHQRSIIICSHTLSFVSGWLWAAANWLKCVRTPFGRTHLNHNTYMHILDYNYITFVVPFVPFRLYFRCQILYKFRFCVTNRNGLLCDVAVAYLSMKYDTILSLLILIIAHHM